MTKEIYNAIAWIVFAIFHTCIPLATYGVGNVECSDDEVREQIRQLYYYVDDYRAARMAFKRVLGSCGTDTNRLARLFGELIDSKDARVRRGVVGDLEIVGTTNELPILYAEINSKDVSSYAMRSILRIEGLTDRVVKTVDEYLNHSDRRARLRYEVCERFLEEMKKADRDSEMWEVSRKVVIDFMAHHNLYHDWVDKQMMEVDPSYKTSDERRSVMKAILEREKEEQYRKYPTAVLEENASLCAGS